MELTDIHVVKSLMESHGIRFRKKFGQNFLINKKIVSDIAENCGAKPVDGILEIGPGIGVLTAQLCQRYRRVVGIEIDKNLIPVLHETLSAYDNVNIICQDVMKTDLKALLKTEFSGMRVSVCANLPYYITTPILMQLFESELPFSHITVMVQREVADRLCAAPGTADYGAITAAVSYYAKPRRLFTVSRGNFMPPPHVDSAVVRCDLYDTPPVMVKDKQTLFCVIRAAFAQRRKTLCNALVSAFPGFDKETIAALLTKQNIPLQTRGETLDLMAFSRIADALFVAANNDK